MRKTIPDEVLLALASKNSGGGTGGTTNYNDLENKPKIAGVTLSGNKSLSDLGIASANDLQQVAGSIPTSLSALTEDSTHRTVTDSEKSAWNGKQSALPVTVSGDDVTFSGSITDGEGNELASVESLEVSASGNPIIVNAVDVECKELVETLEPIQDLHGYSYPWAGGAGKNLLPMTVSGIKSANTSGTWSGNTYTINSGTFTINTDSDGNIASIKVNGTFSASTLFNLAPEVSVNGSYTANGCPSGGASITYRLDIRDVPNAGVLFTDIGSGFSGTITNKTIYGCIRIEGGTTVSNKVFTPMLRLSTITDSTFAPYTNICPISGRTGTEVVAYGQNFIDITAYSSKAPEVTIANDTIRVTAGNWKVARYTFYLHTGIYTFSFKSVITSGSEFVNFTDANENSLFSINQSTVTNYSRTFTASTSGNYILTIGSATNVTTDITFKEVQINAGDVSLPYVPYVSPSTATLSFGQTVYGGTVDFKTGKVTVTKKGINLGSYNWTAAGTNTTGKYRMLLTLSSDIAKSVSSEEVSTAICDIFKTVSAGQTYRCTQGVSANGSQIIVYDERYNTSSSATDFKTAMDGVTLAYELATPTELTLTPQQLTLLKGYNYISADGVMDITFVAKNLPSTPTTDGTYKLIVTVANGVPTFSWVANS